MKIPRAPHSWSVSPRRAVEIQRRLARRVSASSRSPAAGFRYVAGVDAAFSRDETRCIAGVVVWDLVRGVAVESRTAIRPLTFPYVPGLLSFREAPAILGALRRLRVEPDALICDGHGLAHPRRFGIACHVGVLVDRATIGCAKTRLVGEHREPGASRGSRARLTHEGVVLGTVVRTRTDVRPVFVSVGHRIDLESAVRSVLRCGAGYRLPEPTRLADALVSRVRKLGTWVGAERRKDRDR